MEILTLTMSQSLGQLVIAYTPFLVTFSMLAVGGLMLKGSWTQLREGVLRTCECRSA